MSVPVDSKISDRLTLDAAPAARVPRIAGTTLLALALVTTAARLALPIPGTPVPVTLQDLAVLVVGVLLGPRHGAAALAVYVGMGALGAPVFSNGNAGLAWLMGPTGGYLLAYPLAAFVVGAATMKGRAWPVIVAGVLAAQAVIYAGGVLQLAVLTGNELSALLALGVTPFLPGAAMKIGVLLTFVWALRWKRASDGKAETSEA